MNTWFVGNHPVGHYVRGLGNQDSQMERNTTSDPSKVEAEKVFFMKARIFAGQADLRNNQHSIDDFKWLAKEEIQKLVHPNYWARVKNMLVEQ